MEQLKEKPVFITAKHVKNTLNGKTYGEIREILEIDPGEHELLPNGEEIPNDVVCTVDKAEEWPCTGGLVNVEIRFTVGNKEYGQMFMAKLGRVTCRFTRPPLEALEG
jgi:hypothetical protein